MGVTTRGFCKCGLATESIMIGGGMLNFHYTDYYPCLCVDCEDVVEVNLKGLLKCPNCNGVNIIPYDDERLKGENTEPEIRITMYHDVSNGFYYCPKCKEMTLTFSSPITFWD